MSPLVIPILTAVIDGAKDILTSKQAFKDNLKSGSTKAAGAVGAVLAGNVAVNPPETIEGVVLNAVLAVTALILFFYRKHTGKE